MVEKGDFPLYLDMGDAMKRLGNMKAVYISLLRKFLDNTSIADLRYAVQKGDTKAIDDTSHNIKGLAGNLSLPALHKAAATLNTAIRAGASPGEMPQAVYDTWDRTAFVIGAILTEEG